MQGLLPEISKGKRDKLVRTIISFFQEHNRYESERETGTSRIIIEMIAVLSDPVF